MTLGVMAEFSVVFQSVPGGVKVFPGSYPGKEITNEPDLSLYPFALLAQEFSSVPVEIRWNNQPFQQHWSRFKQEDKIFKSWYYQLCTGRKEFNLKATPDLFPPLLLAGIVKKRQLCLQGVSHLRYKESNRGLVLARELARFGIELKIRGDSIELVNPDFNPGKNIQVDPAADHRLAMFFAIFSLVYPGKITIANKECTEKSWPGFWEEMRKLN
jgi:5-enolpyruvylshikimate-3-phosphate synthase